MLAACRRRNSTHTPVWFMRQAGRSLPEYRALRESVPMLEACQRPDMIADITLQPVRRHNVDAAIFFSDIMVPLRAVGVEVDIAPGIGPVVTDTVSRREDVARIRPLDPDDVPYVSEAAAAIAAELDRSHGGIPLIGFAGAPFTLASYLVEGGPSKEKARTKALMWGEPDIWHALCERLAQISAEFLAVQVRAGARVVQLFDSWAGALSEADYRRYVQPHSAAVLTACHDLDVPRIHFGVGTAELLPAMAEAGADVVGVDWRTPLDVASGRVGPNYAVQGNLDPALLLAPWPVLEADVRRVVDEGLRTPGHVFNLGHGVLPETDPTVLTRVVELVHEYSAKARANADGADSALG